MARHNSKEERDSVVSNAFNRARTQCHQKQREILQDLSTNEVAAKEMVKSAEKSHHFTQAFFAISSVIALFSLPWLADFL